MLRIDEEYKLSCKGVRCISDQLEDEHHNENIIGLLTQKGHSSLGHCIWHLPSNLANQQILCEAPDLSHLLEPFTGLL